MQHFLILALVSIAVLAQAQDFAPIGARWIYDSKPEYLDKFQLTSKKDTIINNKVSRKIEIVQYVKTLTNWKDESEFKETIDTLNPYYIHQDADTVYLYNSDKQVFHKIYVFNVFKGDTITLDIPFNGIWENTEFRVVIDSVVTEFYGDKQLKKYKTRALDDFGYEGNWYLDRVGSLSWFLPEGLFNIMEGPGPLNCYKDSEIAYPDASHCDLPTGVSKKQLEQMFSVYPNPAKDKIWIKSTQEIDKVEIYSIHGSLLRTSLSDEINTSNLNTGQYLLKIYSGNDFVVKSIVVE